jgi:hypothetical protein
MQGYEGTCILHYELREGLMLQRAGALYVARKGKTSLRELPFRVQEMFLKWV